MNKEAACFVRRKTRRVLNLLRVFGIITSRSSYLEPKIIEYTPVGYGVEYAQKQKDLKFLLQ